MARIRQGLITATITAVLLATGAAPALAGDTGGPVRSPVGDWQTTTRGVQQTITFAPDGKVFGDSGCNRFTGAYRVKGSRISIGPLATTLMACEPDVMAAEQTFLTRLQAAVSYTATKKVLKVFAPKDMVRFVRS